MSEAEAIGFAKCVRELFRARWTDAKIARWAGSAASGYGRYFTENEARPLVREICLKILAENRAADREISALLRQHVAEMRAEFPSINALFR